MGERCVLYYIHKILMRERERELNSMRNIIRIVFANCLAYFSYFLFFLFSHSYKLVKCTHIHPHTHIDTPINTHTYSHVCTVIAKSFNTTLQPKKHLICVLFLWGHQHNSKWVKAKQKLSVRQGKKTHSKLGKGKRQEEKD